MTIVRKLDEIFTRLVGVSTAVRSPATDVASRMPSSGRSQFDSPLLQNATATAAASAASSRVTTLFDGRPGMQVR